MNLVISVDKISDKITDKITINDAYNTIEATTLAFTIEIEYGDSLVSTTFTTRNIADLL